MMRKILVILVLCILLCGCSISHGKKEYYCENGTLVNTDVCKIDEESKKVDPRLAPLLELLEKEGKE